MVHKMTIEKMTIMSYIFLVVAVVLGIVAVVLFFTLRIPKAYRAVKGHTYRGKRSRHVSARKKMRVNKPETVKLEEDRQQDSETEVFCEGDVQFTVLQDITYVHADEER